MFSGKGDYFEEFRLHSLNVLFGFNEYSLSQLDVDLKILFDMPRKLCGCQTRRKSRCKKKKKKWK